MLLGLALLLVADSAAYTGGSPRLPLASRARPALAVLGQDAADEVLSRRLAEESTGTLLGATALSMGLANFGPTSAAWLGLWNIHVGPAIAGHALSVRGWINEVRASPRGLAHDGRPLLPHLG